MSLLETRALVVKIEGQHAMVQPDQASGCGQCDGKGCGAGKLSRLFCSKPRQFQVNNSINADVGDEVIVSIAEGAVMRGIGMVYLMPLAFLVMGSALGNMLVQQPGQSDSYSALGAFFGLGLGFGIAKWASLRRHGSRFQPYITRKYREEL